MKSFKNLIPLLLFFAIYSCTGKKTYIIKGEIPNSVYEGKTIYLLAMDAAVSKNVDSVKVVNSTFIFQGKMKGSEMKFLRVRPTWPHIMQELLLVIEPGTIEATIDSISTGGGTPLNDSLQSWKETKQLYDTKRISFYAQKQKIRSETIPDNLKLDAIQVEIEKLDSLFLINTIQVIKENNQNLLGQFLFKIYSEKLDWKVKKEILSTANEYFLDDGFIKEVVKELENNE